MGEEASNLWAAIAPAEREEEFARELAYHKLAPVLTLENFHLFEGPFTPLAWAAVRWRNVQREAAPSINAAAKALRPRARRWQPVSFGLHRRAALIAENLRVHKRVHHEFGTPLEAPEGLGAFTLADEQTLLWAKHFDRPDPAGVLHFHESPAAPSRAYLKLWEAFTLGEKPAKGENTLDLGACPGGWTWVLASLGANVLSVDGAPLDPRVLKMPGVTFKKGDAFQLRPEDTGPVDWLCSDVICYPEKLLELVERWLPHARRMVCTLKFQGAADPGVVAAFQRHGRVIHLHHNKHELTFFRA